MLPSTQSRKASKNFGLLIATTVFMAWGCSSSPTSSGPGSAAQGGLPQATQGGTAAFTGGNGGQQNATVTALGTLSNGGARQTGGNGASSGGSGTASLTGGVANSGGTASNITGGQSAGNSSAGASSTGGKPSGGAGTGGASNTGGKSTTGAGVGGSSGGSASTGGKSAGGTGTGGTTTTAHSTGTAATGGSSTAGGTSTVPCTFTVSSALASANNSKSPTTVGIVKWSVTGITPTTANIEFGLDTTYGMTAPVDLTLANYQTPLLGMKPAKTYHFHVVASNGSAACASNDYTIQTGAKTTAVSIGSFTVKNASAHKPGFIVTSYWQGTGSSVPFILDADGEIVWWYGGGPSGGIARARMSVDAKNLWMVVPDPINGAPVQRVSLDTLDAQTYSSTIASHDIAAVSGSTMAYIDYSVTCNGIMEITPSGTTKKIVDATSFLPTTAGCHGNALRYSKQEDFYTYSDYQTDVYVLNRSGSVQWKLSQKVSGGNSSWGGAQHGHQLLDSSIIILANNGGGTNASAAIEYGLDGSLIKKFTSGGYTQNLGDVERLPGGNTLITYSNGGLIQELDSSGNVVLEIKGTTGAYFGYVEWRDSLYGAPIDIAE